MVQLSVPSHGEQLLGVFYLAQGRTASHCHRHARLSRLRAKPRYRTGRSPSGMECYGGPLSRVVGVKGDFSFTHVLEDADAEVAFSQDPATVAKYRIDLTRIVLIGHSMGGFAVASAAAHDPKGRRCNHDFSMEYRERICEPA